MEHCGQITYNMYSTVNTRFVRVLTSLDQHFGQCGHEDLKIEFNLNPVMNSAERTAGICSLNKSSEFLSFLLFNRQVLAGARFKEHSKDLCQRSKCMTNKYAFPGLHKCTTYNKGSKNHFTLIYIFGLDLSHLPKPDKT